MLPKRERTNTIRASEIGVFLYCRRVWWYQRQGHRHGNQAELVTGTRLHVEHGRAVMTAGLLRLVGYAPAIVGIRSANHLFCQSILMSKKMGNSRNWGCGVSAAHPAPPISDPF